MKKQSDFTGCLHVNQDVGPGWTIDGLSAICLRRVMDTETAKCFFSRMIDMRP